MEDPKTNTKPIRLAINGFGRIGRAAFKIALAHSDIEIAAINDLTDPKTLAYLLQYDTVYGKYYKKVSASRDASNASSGSIVVDGKPYPVLSQKDPAALPWRDLGVDVVIESTGIFITTEAASAHIKAGARSVIISAPAKDEATPTYVMSVNTGNGIREAVVSNASCTTNNIAPVAAIIDKEFGIVKAMMTTIHSYTADQNLVDGPHKDLRRARAAAMNIVPTTTGAATAAAKTVPSLVGKFDGLALRVPTIVGSLSDFSILLKRKVTVEEVNSAFRKAAEQPEYRGILSVTDEPIVSSDIVGDAHSAIVDLSLTQVVDGDFLKVLAWYDNEWGYSNRLIDMVAKMGGNR